MLDYTLVTATATYRLPTPRDVPALLDLVKAFYAEELPGREMPSAQVLQTVRLLDRDKGKGTFFVFERGQDLVGYCILINYWSNELGGNVLVVDELYVSPAQRAHGIAADFLTLMEKVAPAGSVAIQLEVDRRNKRAAALYRKLGFCDSGTDTLLRVIQKG